ncbi:hypothetical protein SCATT_00020 [Streptantibioticus cattleyicolor NRRL 8057 = DSM 46488]|uniref:Uncharacterized protein n=1 Tax=Streptantibioticus cattleyicolor (strain ATCC 35852 / DSM 46488 / JCM 4925 / NBRC 14057 / NRRL 8057) TaxID=1003195 RepID=G8WVS8_STREN|nr:hypothetical protein SCATT_00020 [Streptantibioticus cattleyicolor NRRL 8057 = DSM 46488]
MVFKRFECWSLEMSLWRDCHWGRGVPSLPDAHRRRRRAPGFSLLARLKKRVNGDFG